MGWVSEARAALAEGRSAIVRPRGDPMQPRRYDDYEVVIDPLGVGSVSINDVVFVEWKGHFVLSTVNWVEGDRFLIGDRYGECKGWVSRSEVLGRLNEYETLNRRTQPPRGARLCLEVRVFAKDEEGRAVASLCQHADTWNPEVTDDEGFRERIVRAAYEGFLEARKRLESM